MEQGQFAYRKNLEAARKALLDQGSTEFKSDTASDSLAKTEQGLMRPKKRPESISGGMASGMGKHSWSPSLKTRRNKKLLKNSLLSLKTILVLLTRQAPLPLKT